MYSFIRKIILAINQGRRKALVALDDENDMMRQ
jgi:hypothetical protein